MIKEYLISFFIMVLIDNAWWQLIPLLLMSMTMCIGILRYKPFQSKRDNYFMIIIEFLYVSLFGVMLWMLAGGGDAEFRY